MARTSRRNQSVIETKNTVYKAAGYGRVSVTKKNYPSESIENQIKIINEFIDTQYDIHLYKFYIDENEKGTDFNRKEFQNMLKDISDGKINCVIVKDLSRLGRDSISVGYYIQQFFPSKQVRFISLNDNFDTLDGISNKNDPYRPISKIPTIAVADEFNVRDISNKVKTGIDYNIKCGKFVAPRAPFGYKKSGNDCHKLIIDDKAAFIVKTIFNLACENKGLNKITRLLNETGYPTPMTYALSNGLKGNYNTGNGLWNTRTIRDILRNKVYVGDLEQGKEKYLVQNTHEAIISRDLFGKVQAIINKNACPYKEKLSLPKENIFKGKIICGDCSGKMQRRKRSSKNGDYYYFSCITNNRVSSRKCSGMYIKEIEIVTTLNTEIQKFLIDNQKEYLSLKEQQTSISKYLNSVYNENSSDSNVQNLYEKYVSGKITKEQYVSVKNKIDNQKQLVATYEKELNHINERLNFFDCIFSGNIKLIIKNCVEKIIIYKNKEILVKFSNN